MKIAITGATGFIGKHLVRRLVKEGFNLRLLVYDNASFVKEEKLPLQIVKGDLLKKETLASFVKGTDLVIHLAGTFYPPLERLIGLNVTATAHLLEACSEAGVKKVIFTSSGAVYGEPPESQASKETDGLRPNTLYGLSKKFAEDLLRYYDSMFGIKFVILRFSSVYGPGNNKGVVYNFLKAIKKENRITIYGDGTQARSFLFVSDVVESIVKTLKEYDFKKSDVFNVSGKKLASLNQLIKTIEQLFQRKIEVAYNPQQDNLLQVLWEDTEKAKEILGWQPKISLEEGLKLTIDSLEK